jgi:hypothetical protein
MSIGPSRIDGHYDATGHWLTTKCCFVFCGDRCTCQPPGGLFYNEAFDQKKHPLPPPPPGSFPPFKMRLNVHGN